MQLSLFSISYAGFWGQDRLDLAAFIRKAGELGYDSVMLAGKRPHISPLDASAERLDELRQVMERADIECSVVAAYTDFGGSNPAEVPYLEMQIAYLESLCKIGHKLGAKILRVFTAYEVPGQGPQVTWKNVVTCLREACDRAAPHGMTIAIQNHHDIAVHSDALLELLGDIDRKNCKLGFDAWSPALRGEDLFSTAKRVAPYTVITTNADYCRLPRFNYRPDLINYERASPDLVRAVPFGSGFIDYKAFFAGLVEGGFDGIATYEMCSPLRGGGTLTNLDACAAGYVRWMKEKVATT